MHNQLGFFINGAWTRGAGSHSGAVLNPATGEEIGRVPYATASDLDGALEAAQHGFEIWKRTLPQDRARLVRAIGARLREQVDDISEIITREQGKPIGEARTEVVATAELFEWLAEESRRIYGRVVPSRFSQTRTFVLHEPVGPVAAFSPWNFPCMMPGRKIAHALAAGCSIVLKPAEETPGTAVALGKICEQAGVPAGVVNIVFGTPAEVSEYLIRSPIIRKVSLTASVAVGKTVAALAGSELKRVTLELGGHAPAIIFDDADLNRAVSLTLTSRFRNAGQVCTAPARLFVHEAVYDEFLHSFVSNAQKIAVGNGLDPKTQMGPLANSRRLETMERFVADAERRGAQVAAGGRRVGNNGFFFSPTVLTGVSKQASLMNEEIFGPLTPIVSFRDIDEVIAEANRLPYGLAAYAFTGSQSRSAWIADRLKAGVVAVNGVTVTAPEGPFGGVKDSGVGRESGIEGLLEHTDIKTVTETYAWTAA